MPGQDTVGQVDEITLRPLSFYEFLAAAGNSLLLERIDKFETSMIPALSITAETKLKEYMYVGGMPEAVNV